jgi:hypothetical protein
MVGKDRTMQDNDETIARKLQVETRQENKIQLQENHKTTTRRNKTSPGNHQGGTIKQRQLQDETITITIQHKTRIRTR